MHIKKFNEDVKKFLPNFVVQTTIGYDEKNDQELTHVRLILEMIANLEPKDATPENLVALVQKQLEDIIRFSALVGKGDGPPPKKARAKKEQ